MSVFDDNFETQVSEVLIEQIYQEAAQKVRLIIAGENRVERMRLVEKFPDITKAARHYAERAGAFITIGKLWNLITRYEEALKLRSYQLTDEEKYLIMDTRAISKIHKDYIEHSIFFPDHLYNSFEELTKKYGV